MTNVKEQAVELINRMSDEKVMTVIAFVKNMMDKTDSSSDIEKRRAAFSRLAGLTADNPVSLEKQKEINTALKELRGK
ncbi:hypothetical protein FACS1894172_07970 [Spirochaetia bacterium]|nr:hypothetical protein FACS1894164_05950 [Spirochaetia bacterium]GHU32041.1 hypothetical protein FACS1894172_07970 [Spirochaetia bacterium]